MRSRERVLLRADAARCRRRRPPALRLGGRGRRRRGQRDADLLADRRVAQPRLGAALVGDLERQLGQRSSAGDRHVRDQFVVIDDLFAEVFVVFGLALRQDRGAELRVRARVGTAILSR